MYQKVFQTFQMNQGKQNMIHQLMNAAFFLMSFSVITAMKNIVARNANEISIYHIIVYSVILQNQTTPKVNPFAITLIYRPNNSRQNLEIRKTCCIIWYRNVCYGRKSPCIDYSRFSSL